MVRTFTCDLKKKLGKTIRGDSPIVSWMIRHAAYVLNRFAPRPSGRTPHEELKMVRFVAPLLCFGESVIARKSGVPDNRLSTAWATGIWLGKRTETGEHIIGTSAGIIRARTIRRRPDELQWDSHLFECMVFPAWSQNDVKESRQLTAWTPTDGCQACEDEKAPVRRVGRPKKHTPACVQRQADIKKMRLEQERAAGVPTFRVAVRAEDVEVVPPAEAAGGQGAEEG